MIIDSPIISGSLILTGSAAFTGSLTLSGSMNTVGTITATTLVVQTITSSITTMTGSTSFGSSSINNHNFTGSLIVSGAMFVSASGQVGIGISNPNELLHIYGSSPYLLLQGSEASAKTLYIRESAGGMYFGEYGVATRIFISSSGNVGIGTSSPEGLLHVGSSAAASVTTPTAIVMDGTYRSGTAAFDKLKFYLYRASTETYGFGLGGEGDVQYWAGATSNGMHKFFTKQTERVRILANGNVLINGTSDPSVKFQVTQTNTGEWTGDFKSYVNNAYGLRVDLSSSTGATGGYALGVYTQTGTGLFIKNDGTTGLGTTSPSLKFTISHDVTMNDDVTAAQVLIGGGTTTDKRMIIGYDTNSNGFGFIKCGYYNVVWTPLVLQPNGGNVLIGTSTNPGYKLSLNGQPGANGYTAWTNYSDIRLKENITDLDSTNILSKISSLRPVTFNYNELSGYDEETRSRRISGFIAQELMEVFPEMVGTITKDDVEYYDTNTSNLQLYLVKAIQELNTKLDAANAEIEALKAK